MTTRALTMLNENGDTTVMWTEESDAKWEEFIKQKMKLGFVFFIIEPRFFGLLPSKKTEIKNPKEALKHRSMSIPDELMAQLVESGDGEAVATPDGKIKGSRVSRDPKEVAGNQSVGVRQRSGG